MLENWHVPCGAGEKLEMTSKAYLLATLEKHLSVSKQGATFPLTTVSTALIVGRLLGMERISHFEDIENETLLKRYFGWRKLPDYTTYYNDL